MRVFVAGASGVIGLRLLPLLVRAGHEVAGMTRTGEKAARITRLGAHAVVADVYERDHLLDEVGAFHPELIVHQLTDLPDDVGRVAEFGAANARIRREGTDNLLAAARDSGAARFLAQSVAWPLEGDGGEAVTYLETAVLDFGGTVLRYGRLYGPGTYSKATPPPPPRIHVDDAAERTFAALEEPRGIVEITEAAK